MANNKINPPTLNIIGGGTSKKKMPLGLKIPLIFVSVILSIVLVLVISVFACFYVPRTKTISVDKNLTINDCATAMVSDAITLIGDKESDDYGHAILEATADGITQLIYSATGGKRFVEWLDTQIYVENKGTEYTFLCDAAAYGFETQVAIVSDLTVDLIDGSEEGLIFAIKDARVGRIGGMMNLVSQFLPADFEKTFNETFEKIGIHMTLQISKSRIIYKLEDLKVDIVNFIPASEEYELYIKLLGELLNYPHFISINTNDSIKIDLDFNDFQTNDVYFPSLDLDPWYPDGPKKRDTIKPLIDKHGSEMDTGIINALLRFMFIGYDYLNDEEQDIVLNYEDDLLEMGIIKDSLSVPGDDKYTELYGDIFYKHDFNISQYVIDKAKEKLMEGNIEFDVTIPHQRVKGDPESVSLQDMLCNPSVIGSGYNVIFNRAKKGSGEYDYNINYISINDMYTLSQASTYPDPQYSDFTIVTNLDINGFPTQLGIVTIPKTSTSYDNQLILRYSRVVGSEKPGVYFGNYEASEELMTTYIDSMADKINSLSPEFLYLDKEEKQITISVEDAVNNLNEEFKKSSFLKNFSIATCLNISKEGLVVTIKLSEAQGRLYTCKPTETIHGTYNISPDHEIVPAIGTEEENLCFYLYFLTLDRNKRTSLKIYPRFGNFEDAFDESGKYSPKNYLSYDSLILENIKMIFGYYIDPSSGVIEPPSSKDMFVLTNLLQKQYIEITWSEIKPCPGSIILGLAYFNAKQETVDGYLEFEQT